MSFGLGISGALEGASKGTSIGSIIPGLGTAAGGIIGGGLGLLGGLFGSGSSTKQQKELMDKAWEYEKEGMGMQYQYGQMAANEASNKACLLINSPCANSCNLFIFSACCLSINSSSVNPPLIAS